MQFKKWIVIEMYILVEEDNIPIMEEMNETYEQYQVQYEETES